MTEELKYYKFIDDNVSTIYKPEESNGHGLMVYFNQYAIDDFRNLVGHDFWDDGYGNEVTSLCADGDICVEDFDNWLDMCGIDWKDVIKE